MSVQLKIWEHLGKVSELFLPQCKDNSQAQDFLCAIDAVRRIASENGSCARVTLPFLPNVYLGIPHLNGINWETAKAVLQRYSNGKVQLKLDERPSSLLANSFNWLFCNFLNARIYDYWILCHADIGFVTDFFVDIALEDIKDFDVLHVPMAMKDDRGLISTALGSRKHPWGNKRRLTSKELLELPEVFGLQDMVEVMSKTGPVPEDPCFCPNTGVLIMKKADWMWDFPGFEIRDRIVTRSEGGQRMRYPFNLSEDWNFGQWAAEYGLKVGGTRRIKTNHYGHAGAFPNYTAWGQEKDETFLASMEEGHGMNADVQKIEPIVYQTKDPSNKDPYEMPVKLKEVKHAG